MLKSFSEGLVAEPWGVESSSILAEKGILLLLLLLLQQLHAAAWVAGGSRSWARVGRGTGRGIRSKSVIGTSSIKILDRQSLFLKNDKTRGRDHEE